jgi:hypothetical protein
MATLRIPRAGAVAAAIAAASLALAASAEAQTGPPSAVDQYVEMVPDADGPTAPRAGKKPAPLPKESKDALEEAPPETAATLEEVATSPTYGAPSVPKKKPVEVGQTPAPRPDRVTVASASTTLESAGAIASASVSDTRLVGLLIAILATTLGAAAVAVARARH